MATGQDHWQPSPVQARLEAWPVTVTGKPSLDVPPGTLKSILKQAGLKS